MKKLRRVLPMVAFMLSGCMPEELPVPAHPRGAAHEIQVCMGAGYQEQLWLDLGTGETVSSNIKTDWSLAFESAPEGWRVMLNGSLLMTAWNLGPVSITDAADTVGLASQRRIDAPSGHPDSTAFGDWRSTSNIYVVDLGYDASGQQLGYRKVRMLGANAISYQFEVARLDGTGLTVVALDKDPLCTYTYFSFSSGQVSIAPRAGAWDIVLTQYTHQFYEPFLPYIVSGVLIDGNGTRASRIGDADFASVTLADTLQHPFETRRNIIGYDWKAYSFDTGTYLVDPNIIYIVQDGEGFFHKLHFLEFYGPQGQAGCPLFEVEPL